MNKYLFPLYLLILVLFPAMAQAAPHVAATPIALGVTVPLSGDFASYGDLIRKGVELAREDLAAEGFPTTATYEDACLPATAVAALNKLISVDRIQALAANFCVIAMPAMAPAIERAKLVAFHTASVSDSILDAGKYIFGTNVKVRDEARKLAEYAWRHLGAKTASVMFIATDFGEDYHKHFAQRFQELGGAVLTSDRAAIGVNDFKAELNRIRAKKPDVIFAAHLGLTLGVLLKQKRELGIPSRILGVYEAEDPSVVQVAQEAAEGIQFFVPEPVEETQAVRTFQARFKQRYSEEPRILARNAYDGTRITVRALAECRMDPECARDRIYQIKDYEGASGRFSFDEDGGVRRELILKTIKSGQFERVNWR